MMLTRTVELGWGQPWRLAEEAAVSNSQLTCAPHPKFHVTVFLYQMQKKKGRER